MPAFGSSAHVWKYGCLDLFYKRVSKSEFLFPSYPRFLLFFLDLCVRVFRKNFKMWLLGHGFLNYCLLSSIRHVCPLILLVCKKTGRPLNWACLSANLIKCHLNLCALLANWAIHEMLSSLVWDKYFHYILGRGGSIWMSTRHFHRLVGLTGTYFPFVPRM